MKKETVDMVKQIIDRMNGWSKILVVMIPLTFAGLIGYGNLQSEVSNKASAERVGILETTVSRNYEIIKELKISAEQNQKYNMEILTKITALETLIKNKR